MDGIIKSFDNYVLYDGIITRNLFWKFCSVLSDLDGSFNPPLSKRFEGLSELASIVEFLERRITVDTTECLYLVDVNTHEIVGFSTYETVKDDSELSTFEIGISAVSPLYQGKGLSEHLYDGLEYVANSRLVHRMTRGTWSDNYKQIARYEKRGFTLVGEYSRLSIGSRTPRVEYEKWL